MRVSKDTQGKFKSINLDLQILPDGCQNTIT